MTLTFDQHLRYGALDLGVDLPEVFKISKGSALSFTRKGVVTLETFIACC